MISFNPVGDRIENRNLVTKAKTTTVRLLRSRNFSVGGKEETLQRPLSSLVVDLNRHSA
jgi:hypothetical protein